MIRIILPQHLRTLAGVGEEVEVPVEAPVTIERTLNALEHAYPVLRGTIRDQHSLQRRPFVRYFACQDDLSHEPPPTLLPDPILQGNEPLMIVGAIAGG